MVQKVFNQEFLKPFKICGSINFGNLRAARGSHYQANKVGFMSFGSSEYQKQTSLGFKPSVAFLKLFNKYKSKQEETSFFGQIIS